MLSLMLEVVSASCTEILTDLIDKGIILFDISFTDEITVQFRIRASDYHSVAVLVKKAGATCSVVNKEGKLWPLRGLAGRPVILIGISLLLLLVLYLPSRVLFISIEGNEAISDQEILAHAEVCGIRFGASRRLIRSENVKNMLLEKMPELQWAAINTNGCLAVISVREKMQTNENKDKSRFCNIVAAEDGVVIDATATKGTLLCKPGQVVNKGQILISGYCDFGLVVKATGAEGEVTAQTIRKISVQIPAQYTKRTKKTANKDKYSLLIGKKLINFFKDSGIYPNECVRIYKEYYMVLPGGYHLPVSLIKNSYQYYDVQTSDKEDIATYEWVADNARIYVLNRMLGGEIVKQHSKLELQAGVCQYQCTYICREVISRIHYEEILQQHE